MNIQYKSPSSPSPSLLSPFPPFSLSRPHSQSGYSESSFAMGGSLPLTYPSPFSTVPAFTELRGPTAAAAASAASAEVVVSEGFLVLGKGGVEGVSGVENGCAAEVERAAGGGPAGLGCVVWFGVVEGGASRREVVERRRKGRRERGVVVVRRWRQRGQIIVVGVGGLGLLEK